MLRACTFNLAAAIILSVMPSPQMVRAQAKPGSPQNAPIEFQSSDRRTALLELFTSEGCSSCPPAEAWLSRLKDSPGLWKEFVPVAFHVDYWDYLGWRDRWSSKAFSERQQVYARSWRSDSVYTPGFVLNGKEWRSWSNLKEGPHAQSSSAGVLKVASSDLSHWQIVFSPLRPTQAGYEFHVLLLGSGLTSEVKAGENRGRRLIHDFVALEVTRGSLSGNGGAAQGEFTFHLTAKPKEGQLALAVWVTTPGSLEPIQATGGWLSAS